MEGAAIFVFTGSFQGRVFMAKEIAKWLVAPSLYMQSIVDGLLPRPPHTSNNSLVSTTVTRGIILEGLLLPPAAHTANIHGYNQEDDELSRAALRMVFSQLPQLAQTMHGPYDCIVLELPWCSRALVEMLMSFLNDHLISKKIDRGMIIKCTARENINTIEWHRIEDKMRYHGIFVHDYYYNKSTRSRSSSTSQADRVEKAIAKQLRTMSSKFEDIQQQQRRGGVNNSFVVSELEIDPIIDRVDFPVEMPSLLQDDMQMPSNFHHAIYCLAFIRPGIARKGGVVLSMREWAMFVIENFPVVRSESATCFTRQDAAHRIAYTTQLLNKEHGSQLSCRVCGKLVTDPTASYSCLYCPLEMHKACAELVHDDDNDDHLPLQPLARADAYDAWTSLMERNDDGDVRTTACPSCNAKGKLFSRDCLACVFDTFLKCRLLPLIIPHPFLHQDFLTTVVLRRNWKTTGTCTCCGEAINSGSIFYQHINTFSYYGFACISLLPLQITEPKRNKHFGHYHPLKLMDKPHQEDFDTYICHICLQERDPLHWYYFCEECEYTVHIYCLFEFDRHRH